MFPKISLIVPVYNVEKYLSQCLDSLIGQTMHDIEIICVNDGSSDSSLDILREYALRDSRIFVFNQPNGGVSVARNNALRYVRGEYYMFVDSDDWLDFETCEVTYNYAKQNDADCLMFSYTKEFGSHSIVNHIFDKELLVWEKDEVLQNFHRRLYGPIGKELAKPQDMDLLVTPCMQLFKSAKFANIEFVDIREVGTFEDGLYQMVVYNDCDRFVYIDKPYYHYRKTNATSITTKYKSDLYEKYINLYSIIDSYILKYQLEVSYKEALNNRIAINTLALGLNSVHAPNCIINNVLLGGVNYLKSSRIRESLKLLDTGMMPFPWKVFYFLNKHRMKILLTLMLLIIEFARTHKISRLRNENQECKNKCNSTRLQC